MKNHAEAFIYLMGLRWFYFYALLKGQEPNKINLSISKNLHANSKSSSSIIAIGTGPYIEQGDV
jgi:hypothetical protein